MERREITFATVSKYFAIKVGKDQMDLVAPNEKTLAQTAYDPGAYVWGLWDDETPVGLMAMIHPHQSPAMQPDDDPDGAYLWRLMVGAPFQGKGFGKFVVKEAIAQTKTWDLPRLSLSVVDEPHSHIGFYEALGFEKTGRLDGEEIELVITV